MYKLIKLLFLNFRLSHFKREKNNVCGYLYCDGWDGVMCVNYIKYLDNEIEKINLKINKLQ